MTGQRIAWIDWMKVIGMALIVIGHTGGQLLLPELSSPFNSKQLGVAFFVFITGYSLARSQGNPLRVVYNRYFEVFFFSAILAVCLSIIQWFRIRDLNESNYLPLFFGANVLENAFPANPTTWYVGTYLHILVLWAVLWRNLKPTVVILIPCIGIEIATRATILSFNRDFTAYMLVTNWLTVFACGWLLGSKALGNLDNKSLTRQYQVAGIALLSIVLMVVAWPRVAAHFEFTNTNPFGRVGKGPPIVSALLTSLCVTFLYIFYTLTVYLSTRNLPLPKVVEFLSKNTLIVFLLHMPLIYAFTPIMYRYIPAGWIRFSVNLLVFFVGIAIVSHGIKKVVKIEKLKSALASFVFKPSKESEPKSDNLHSD